MLWSPPLARIGPGVRPKPFVGRGFMRWLPILLAAAVVAPPVASASDSNTEQRRTERRICRAEVITGTRLRGPRVCRTQREWDSTSEQAREDLTRSQNRQDVVGHGPGGRTSCPVGIPC